MTEERAKACEACVETQQRVNEALATSDACWRMEQEVIVRERDELLYKLAGEAAHIKSLEGLLVDALRERDALHGAMTVRYSLSREIEEIFGVTGAEASDEQLALGVAAARRIVRERDEARAALEESEHQMHLRIRSGYDKTIADCWRAKVAEVEAERDEAQAEVADLSNKYTESWKCSLDVPKDPCFDCIRCLRLRLKGRP